MASQNPEDCKFSLAHLLDDSIQLYQPSTSRRHMLNEVETSERCVQPRSDLDPQQLPLTSLKPDARVLIIILKAKAMLVEGHQVLFEQCFQNISEGQIVSRLSNEVSHCLWFLSQIYDLHHLLEVKLS